MEFACLIFLAVVYASMRLHYVLCILDIFLIFKKNYLNCAWIRPPDRSPLHLWGRLDLGPILKYVNFRIPSLIDSGPSLTLIFPQKSMSHAKQRRQHTVLPSVPMDLRNSGSTGFLNSGYCSLKKNKHKKNWSPFQICSLHRH